jgi:GT2 family glycosyltransferase
MVRRSALESIGGWDERYWMWYDDVDLSRRLAAIGPAVYVPDAVFEHVGAASTRSWRKHEQHLRLYHGTMIYAQAHLSRGQQVVVALTMIGVCAARLLMHAVRRDAAASTYWQLMRAGLRMCTFSSLRAVNGRVARPSPSQSGG